MKRQTSSAREDYAYTEPLELKLTNLQEPVAQYINMLRSQIRHIGTQIDFEFQRSSEFIFSLYKHFYSPNQCQGEKATFLNKLSNCGVQWGLQSAFDQKVQQAQGPSEQGRSTNQQIQAEAKQQENSKRAYNIRTKTKPLKHRYLEEEYDYGDRTQKAEGPRRGRPTAKKDPDSEPRRDTSNPYEKAPYKKRRLPPEEVKEESVGKEEGVRSSMKWESESDKDEEHERHKDNEEERDENQKEFEVIRAEKFTKTADDNKSPLKIIFKGEAAEGEGEQISALVESYRKSWAFYELKIQLQRPSDL